MRTVELYRLYLALCT